ncbi:hypothetical protein P1P75_15870 [Streptomyces sp. ID05-39B]|uniref:hypothetical protein n=1 Tax=Streptomyces sp. ID05-39B TaxID=3028664 RepID=UPI0029B343A9|nr:hypothetical protein [Streptomyces sp. ID05-39B]MDX3527878.1 hypothetical protein [Streptomyces sp. ID05-39B]
MGRRLLVVGRSPDGSGNDGSSISDDELRAFLEESERGAAHLAPKEPSARARMVTERLRQQDARGEGPQPWRPGPAATAGRRRKVWPFVGVALALCALAVSLKPSLLPGDPFGSGQPKDETVSLPAETAAPTAAPGPAPEEVPTLDRPFAGSPAVGWGDGEAGIVLPAAKAVGSISEERVAQALELTKKLLVGANLDRRTLRGERPGAALSVLDPGQPDLLDDLNGSLRSPDEEHDPLGLFSRFDPDEVRLVGDLVKTRGHMTFKKGKYAGVAVHADYTFVYPVSRADGSTEVTRTIVRRILHAELPDPAKYDAAPGRLTLVEYNGDFGNDACDVHDGFLHPVFPSAEPTVPSPTGPTKDPYDRSKGFEESLSDCGTVSRI